MAVLCVGAQIVGHKLAGDILRAYMDARFVADEPFVRRLEKLRALEAQEARALAVRAPSTR